MRLVDKHQLILDKIISAEEMAHIEAFCLTSSRSERMEVLSSIRKQVKHLLKEVLAAQLSNKVCFHVGEEMLKAIEIYKDHIKEFTESEKTTAENTKNSMTGFRVLKNVLDNTLNAGNTCEEHAGLS